jgi:hypothetical protein
MWHTSDMREEDSMHLHPAATEKLLRDGSRAISWHAASGSWSVQMGRGLLERELAREAGERLADVSSSIWRAVIHRLALPVSRMSAPADKCRAAHVADLGFQVDLLAGGEVLRGDLDEGRNRSTTGEILNRVAAGEPLTVTRGSSPIRWVARSKVTTRGPGQPPHAYGPITVEVPQEDR